MWSAYRVAASLFVKSIARDLGGLAFRCARLFILTPTDWATMASFPGTPTDLEEKTSYELDALEFIRSMLFRQNEDAGPPSVGKFRRSERCRRTISLPG